MLSLLAVVALAADPSWPGAADPAPWRSTPSGLQIQDTVVGTGPEVGSGARAEVNYTGWLADGTVFDSSLDRKQTFVFQVGEHHVIAGWEEGTLGMKVGGTRRLAIPPDLGYGDRSVGPIPADSELYFEVTLVGVVPARTAPSQPATVAEDAWREVHGLRVADVVRGHGAPARRDHRVCLDYVEWRGSEVVEQTWQRDRCTWGRLSGEDLPPALDRAVVGMRPGAVRRVEDPESGVSWQVELEHTGR